MAKSEKKYVVRLHQTIVDQCKKDTDFVMFLSGDKFLVCRSINDGGHYLLMEAEAQSGDLKGKYYELRIPHSYVLLIFTNPPEKKPLGFQS